MQVNRFRSIKQASQFVSEKIENLLKSDISANGNASFIVTGGSTIRHFFSKLSDINVDWSKITVILSDERWVEISSNDSNEKQLFEKFISKLDIKPNYISLKTEHKSPMDAKNELTLSLKQIKMPITCSLLSMGEDGHVASLFPQEKEVWRISKESLFCSDVKGPRISLGLDILSKVSHNYILCSKPRNYNKCVVPELNKNSSIIWF
jgi:6-phosphogluconolactonase